MELGWYPIEYTQRSTRQHWAVFVSLAGNPERAMNSPMILYRNYRILIGISRAWFSRGSRSLSVTGTKLMNHSWSKWSRCVEHVIGWWRGGGRGGGREVEVAVLASRAIIVMISRETFFHGLNREQFTGSLGPGSSFPAGFVRPRRVHRRSQFFACNSRELISLQRWYREILIGPWPRISNGLPATR